MAVSPLKRFYWRACEHGYVRAMQLSALDAWDWYQEWRLGIDTEGQVTSEELGYGNPDYQRYMPCSYWEFARALKWAAPTPNDVFLDIGSGKGRALILAATYPIRRAIGVELSQELNEVARRNVTLCKARLRCKNIDVVCADATTFPIPADVTLIHMCNSVTGPMLERILDQIRHSLVSAPRTIRIVYHNITQVSQILEQHQWMRRTRELRSVRGRGRDHFLYEASL